MGQEKECKANTCKRTKAILHKLEWTLVRVLFCLLRRASFEKASNVAGAIARGMGPHLTRNLLAKKNLQRAFPEWSAKELNQTLGDMWENLGRYLGELPHMAEMSAEECAARTEVIGAEHYHAAVANPKGAIFFSAHMGNWEWGAKTAWMLGTPFSIVFRPLNNPYLEALTTGIRNGYQTRGIPKTNSGGRLLVQTLKEGKPVAILLDQRVRSGKMLRFFGQDAPTAVAAAHTSIKYGSPLIPTRVERLVGSRFRVTFEPPLVTEGKTAAEVTQETLDITERWVREKPAQWFWVHRRWAS